MHLLKKDTPLLWNERAKGSFNTLKKSMVSSPILSTHDYNRDLLLYVAVSQETIAMVMVQEDDELHEHIIYYLRQNLIDTEIQYSHIENLVLATVHVVQI